jgi:hypothetical protein
MMSYPFYLLVNAVNAFQLVLTGELLPEYDQLHHAIRLNLLKVLVCQYKISGPENAKQNKLLWIRVCLGTSIGVSSCI